MNIITIGQVEEQKMKFEIKTKETLDSTLEYLISFFPYELGTSLSEFFLEQSFSAINEIRVKKNSFINLIADSKNVKTDIFTSESYMDELFISLCSGSIYAHIETIKEGYISLGQGLRAGICGTAVINDNSISGIKNITSINIRIPQIIINASNYLYSILKKSNFSESLLLYSSPGVGKTSILRDLIIKLNAINPPIRFCVIDSREEIITPYLSNLSCDVFVSYPKGVAIELATKSMTPQIIICDEISSEEEAKAVLKASCNGVKLIATTHAASYQELTSKTILKPLINSNIFNHFIGVSRKYGEKSYNFTLNSVE